MDPRYSQHPIPADQLDGQRYADDALPLTQIENTYGNPGATPNLRGVETNTSRDYTVPCVVPPSGIANHPPSYEETQEMDTTYAYDRDTGVDPTLCFPPWCVGGADEVNAAVRTGGGKWAKAPTP